MKVSLSNCFRNTRQHNEVYEADGVGMNYYSLKRFRNWGKLGINPMIVARISIMHHLASSLKSFLLPANTRIDCKNEQDPNFHPQDKTWPMQFSEVGKVSFPPSSSLWIPSLME